MSSESPQSTNPYQPPRGESEGATAGLRFRWRVVPTVMTGCFAALFSLAGANLFIRSIWWIVQDAEDMPARSALTPLVASLGMLVLGILLFLSACCWWRMRWLAGTLLAATSGAVFVVFSLFG